MNLEDKVDNERIRGNHVAVHPTTKGRAAAANYNNATPDVYVRDDDSMSLEASGASSSAEDVDRSLQHSYLVAHRESPNHCAGSFLPPPKSKISPDTRSPTTPPLSHLLAKKKWGFGLGSTLNEFLTAYRRYLRTQSPGLRLERGRRWPDDTLLPPSRRKSLLSPTQASNIGR